MAEREVFIDTNVFTGIVTDIQNAAASCELSDSPLGNLKVMEGTEAGRKMNKILMKHRVHISMKPQIRFQEPFLH
ncbi:hypothetical protein [Butyrivibrio sp. AE2005]|uniref:hypothetical protein n=1 Tax=Butyrivibrio sp. AE2005 TaxID=1496722 RepID=UPI00047C3690|nr:hypothetical protein [Butyrivibrio sp. AE2005]